MTVSEAFSTCLRKYAEFGGRASRSEFWWFVGLPFIVSLVLGIFMESLGLSNNLFFHAVFLLAGLAITLPTYAVAVRRLHDVDRSGWWLLIPITLIGWIPLLYWFCKAGDLQANQYGPPT